MNVVRPAISSSSASRITSSVFESIEDVGSSRIRIGASLRNARATQIRWRSPPESWAPRSPSCRLVALRAAREMKSWALAALRRRDDLVLGRLEPAVADVLGDRAREEQRLLEHDADLRAQRRAA